uniref:Uncharacterized protein n=1 Tax=Anguilla anguilla TaxID=7936 RepID=A0A0E9SC32_ANGAN
MAITENCLALETCTFFIFFLFLLIWGKKKKPFQGLPFKVILIPYFQMFVCPVGTSGLCHQNRPCSFTINVAR